MSVNYYTLDEMLKLVRRKMFEPRGKIIFDTFGNKQLSYCFDRNNNQTDHVGANQDDSHLTDIIKSCEGWNVADKDYVDYKVTEVLHTIQNLQQKISSTSQIPTAPPLIDTKKSLSMFDNSKQTIQNTNKTIMFSSGDLIDNEVIFFTNGLVLKKGWSITDITIFSSIGLEQELLVSINSLTENKTSQISKIKPQSKQILSAELKYKIENHKAVTFKVLCSKTDLCKNPNFSLQICIDIGN
ncbi:hypothetical protein [Dasineura jujubifolia toursvirus 2a]|nr:hypothetical protein [Dasineura jujubifolia toursvirus 2a]